MNTFDGIHECGVWYSVSDPPKCDIDNIVLCVSGHRYSNPLETYDHTIFMDGTNEYSDGRFYPAGIVQPWLEVHGWYKVPPCDV